MNTYPYSSLWSLVSLVEWYRVHQKFGLLAESTAELGCSCMRLIHEVHMRCLECSKVNAKHRVNAWVTSKTTMQWGAWIFHVWALRFHVYMGSVWTSNSQPGRHVLPFAIALTIIVPIYEERIWDNQPSDVITAYSILFCSAAQKLVFWGAQQVTTETEVIIKSMLIELFQSIG